MSEKMVEFSKVSKGYSIEEVDQYIKLIQDSYQALIDANKQQEKQNLILSEKLKDYDIVTKTLEAYEQENKNLLNDIKQKSQDNRKIIGEKVEAKKEIERLNKEISKLNDTIKTKESIALQRQEKLILEKEEEIKTLNNIQEQNKNKIDSYLAKIEEQTLKMAEMYSDLELERQKVKNLQNKTQEPMNEFAGIFKVAKSAADEYLKSMKSQIENELQDAKKTAEEQKNNAQNKANQIIEKANKEAQKLIKDAEDKRDEMINEAENKLEYTKHKIKKLEIYTQQNINNMIKNAKSEYMDIKKLVKNSAKEYISLCNKILKEEVVLIDDSDVNDEE